MLNISYKVNQNGFKIKIPNNSEYSVNYPRGILLNLSKKNQEIILDNFTYSRTIPLALLAKDTFSYQTSEPFLKKFIDYGVFKDLPRFCYLSKKNFDKLLLNFTNSKILFQNNKKNEKLLPTKKTSTKNAILALSFGKDSLLSYALAKEIGLNVCPVFINDMEKYNPNEFNIIKKKILNLFSKDQKEKVLFLHDDSDNIFRYKKTNRQLDEMNAMLAFALELIPIAYNNQAKYIIFGNEKNFDCYFIEKNKYRVSPSFDQSLNYMKKEEKYFKEMTNDNIQIISLIKPLYNIAETKILYHRYPHLLKYIVGCFSPKLKNNKWCGQCDTCIWAFLYSAAFGSPQKIGLNKNFFEKKYWKFYTLFNSKIKTIDERPPQVKDEQLLIFLLAYRKGYKGGLIDLFKKIYLKETIKRERELRKKFFGIHQTSTIPKELKNKVLKIYQEELKDLW